ncbi:MAG: hypothetical protein IJK02_03135 [Clostridia bacterium]|nr:hypothetical protein [Clostridia bacterium]
MLEKKPTMQTIHNGIAATMERCGFTVQLPEGARKGDSPVFDREGGCVLDYAGEKGRLRLVLSDDRLHLLSGESDADLSDDSAFHLDSTYLLVLADYDERDLKSLINEICEYLTETYQKKDKIVTSNKSVQTVSKSAARSGALAYDPITLASKLAAMFPYFKEEIRKNLDAYGEFLCEDFFVNVANREIMGVINANDPRDMKKLFNILGDIYEDGTNEVQSLIAVTILGPIKDDPVLIQRIMPYLTDTMLEPVLAVSARLKKSKSANMRLENPPKYKPKKEKKSGGILQSLMGGGAPGLQQQ